MKDKLLLNVKAVKPADKSFEAFKKRFHTVMGDKLDMTDEQLRQIYDGVSPYIETSIYAEMEDVLEAIRNAYQAVVGWVTEETVKSSGKDQSNKRPTVQTLGGYKKSFALHKQPNHPDTEAYQNKGETFKNDVIQSYMNHEKSLNRFVTHVVTNYQSLPKLRIDILTFKHKGYQRLECQLFNGPFIQQYGFSKAYHLHNELMKAFYTTFDYLLAKGSALKSDQDIEEQVLEPVLEQFKDKMDAQEGDEHEQTDPL